MVARLKIDPGTAFGRLVVVSEAKKACQPSGQSKRAFLCSCECGATTVALLDNLRSGKTSSCGCGEISNRIKHGRHGQPLYRVWISMHERCQNHARYAGRGIRVCKDWCGDAGLESFIAWSEANGFSLGLDLDRRNNDDDYSPQNCRYVTRSVNQRNKRDTLVIVDPFTGQRVAFIDFWEAHRKSNVCLATARWRIIRAKWDALSAVTLPPYARHLNHQNRRNKK